MSIGVQFDEQNTFKSRTILGNPVRPKVLDFLVKSGIVSDYKKAGYLLLSLVVMAFIASFLILYIGLGFSNKNVPISNIPIGFPIK